MTLSRTPAKDIEATDPRPRLNQRPTDRQRRLEERQQKTTEEQQRTADTGAAGADAAAVDQAESNGENQSVDPGRTANELSWDKSHDVGTSAFHAQNTPGSVTGDAIHEVADALGGVSPIVTTTTSSTAATAVQAGAGVGVGGGGQQAAGRTSMPYGGIPGLPPLRPIPPAGASHLGAPRSPNPWPATSYSGGGTSSAGDGAGWGFGGGARPREPTGGGSRSSTPTPEIAIAKGQYLRSIYRSEYETLNVQIYSSAMLEELCGEASSHKRALSRVEERLLGVPNVAVEVGLFAACRRNFVDFVRKAQTEINSRNDRSARLARPPAGREASIRAGDTEEVSDMVTQVTSNISSLSLDLKKDRVLAREHALIEEMESVAEEAKALVRQNPDGDSAVKVYAERSRGIKAKADELAKEAKELYNDAVDSSQASAARCIYDCMQMMARSARDAAGRVYELKAASRIGLGGGVKDSDFPPPHFSGASDEDLYRFLDLFEQYVDAKGYSDSDSLRAMKMVCLKGQLATTCQDFQTLEQVTRYITDVYGQPRILLETKIKEFLKNGKCPSFPAQKRRDWFIKTQNGLDYLHKLCTKFSLLDELMFSDVLAQVHLSLPAKIHQDYLKRIRSLPLEQRTRRTLFQETRSIIDSEVIQATADVNTCHTLGLKDPEKMYDRPVTRKSINHITLASDESDSDEDQPSSAAPSGAAAAVTTAATVPAVAPGSTGKKKKKVAGAKQNNVGAMQASAGVFTPPAEETCVVCKGKHTHMFYCPGWQDACMDDRIQMAKAQGACRRCLRMDSQLDLSNRAAWFARHEPDCVTDWHCNFEWTCGKAAKSGQIHMTLCKRHVRVNKDRHDEFIASLDQNKIKPGVKFFYASFQADMAGVPYNYAPATYNSEVIRANKDHSIYLLQSVFNEQGEDLLLFYDSGCSVAAISEEAAAILGTRNVIPGPTYLNTAGGQTLKNNGGIDEFLVDLCDGDKKLELRGLVMEQVTNPIALYKLEEAYSELLAAYEATGGGQPLPLVSDTVGGRKVDIMVGIKYLRFFPILEFSLPSGLAIHTTQIKTQCGRRGVIGGPHASWEYAAAQMEYMSPFSFLSAELRAYRAQAETLFPPVMALEHVDPADCEPWDLEADDEEEEETVCACPGSQDVENHLWGEGLIDLYQASGFDAADHLGTELSYRCLRCRSCSDCKKGELIEETSLVEEAEQALLESLVWLLPEERRLECRLPFIKDPTLLAGNRDQAEKIFNSQLKSCTKNLAMKEAVLAAHQKLIDKGHVVCVDDLSSEERKVFNETKGEYVLPWSCVSKPDSVSTPFRVVFNASFKTRSGESLNSCLAKGINNLPQILHLLVRFSSRKYALSADVSMAYNAVKLRPECFKFQQYLWKDNLDPDSPTKTMIVRTLIYGVRPSGNMTGAGFVKAAEYAERAHPELAEGARVIKEDTYVDDSVTGCSTLEECDMTAAAMDKVLQLGGATIKDFAFSTRPPSDKLSADGVHVGVLGYLWDTVKENVFLAVRPIALGKSKRSKKVVEDTDDLWLALKGNFSKRVLSGQLAGIYDPRGLATPVTALLKLDMAEVVSLKTDWDDRLPEELLDKWVENLERVQQLRKVPFPRAVIQPHAVGEGLEIIVSVDASKDVAVAAVHARSQLPDGGYECRLLMAKSKLVHMTTVPRAELKAAVMGATVGHTVLANLKDQVRSIIYVSDSTIVLHWMKQDSRPLQTAVRNSVIEIRRLSDVAQWFHVSSEDNVADVGTRYLDVTEVGPGSDWIKGRPWMAGKREDFPIRSIDSVQLGADELKLASREVKGMALQASVQFQSPDRVVQRYDFSRYLVDPCNFIWPRSVNVLATVFRFVSKIREAISRRRSGKPMDQPEWYDRVIVFSAAELKKAEHYYFLRTTAELRHFAKPKEFEHCTTEVDGVLMYNSRVLDGELIDDKLGILGDVGPLHFFKPMVDRYSPVAYAIMQYAHVNLVQHQDAVRTLRESRTLCFVLRGRDLAIEIVERCDYCKKRRAAKLQNEMAKIHPNALTVGPAFYNVQVDMAGPWFAECEHNCRSKVKVWAVVFKDPATCAVAAYAMAASHSAAFIQAYNRHVFRYGHPAKVYVDAGSQLLKACEEAEFSWTDIVHLISSRYGVGFDYEVCPPHAHYFHGAVERSIKEVKRLFDAVFKGRKLQLLAYETAFAFCSNHLNNLPIALGSKVDHLGHRDVLTPNRLLLGRNNRRAPDSMTQVYTNVKMAEQLQEVEAAWWKIWEKERLVDHVPQPAKWCKTNNSVAVGNVVIFPMAKENSPLKELTWKYGKVVEVIPSRDKLPRRLRITYQNYGEAIFRFVVRGAREVAILHSEDDLDFFRFLRQMAEEFEKQPVPDKAKAWLGVPKPSLPKEDAVACFCQL